ncbi:MAG: 6-phosphogluconolactonase [Deltaproteobacteria bacterium]|jgi:6-phosphogluconolactonase|nr:6-phosphogluconolactonase [Deltaproteobacteria bacterium]
MLRETFLSLTVTESPLEVAERTASMLEEQCAEALRQRKVFNLAVSGGKTPVPLFQLLSSPAWRRRIDWEKTVLYWVDERCVGPDHPDSNYRVVREELLAHVPITRFYRMKGEEEPVRAAEAYERLLLDNFALPPGEIPCFDCILLGVGDDGHVGSLFPHSCVLNEKQRLVADQYIHHLKSSRITMTFPLLNSSRCCIVMAVGKEKHHVLSTALNLMEEPALPAQMLRPTSGRLCWIIDEAAYTGR